MSQQTDHRMMQLLGYAGLIPFYAMLAAILLNIDVYGIDLKLSIAHYAAVIVSFLGAIHWGQVVESDAWFDHNSRNKRLLWSVIPSIFAWLLLSAPELYRLPGLALLIAIAYGIDRYYLASRLNATYLTLRLHLTIGVIIALLLTIII